MGKLIVSDLDFSYGRTRVFDGFSVDFAVGKTLLLGPNGAGKSTLLELVAGVRKPAAGKFLIGDKETSLKYRRTKIGFMPQRVTALRGLSVTEQVAYSAWLTGMSRKASWNAAIEMVAAVGLGELANRRAAKISGGQLRRVGLASLLVAAPEVLLLDEPLAGLDPGQQARFRELLLSDICADKVVVISSHQLEDVAGLFDRVVVISAGQRMFTGTTSEFLAFGGVGGSDSARAAIAYSELAGGREL